MKRSTCRYCGVEIQFRENRGSWFDDNNVRTCKFNREMMLKEHRPIPTKNES